MGKLSFPKIGTQTLLLSAVPLTFLVLLLALALVLQSKNALIAADSQRSAQVLSQSDHAMQLLDEAGGSIGAYARTRNEAALAQYRAAVRELPGAMAALAYLVGDDPTERLRAARLTADVSEGVAVLKEYLYYVRTRNAGGQKRLEESHRVRQLSSNIASLAAAVNNGQRAATVRRLKQIHAQIRDFTIGLVGLCIVGIAVTLAVSVRFGLGITRRVARLTDNAQRLARGEKTEPIGGNDEISNLDLVYQQMTQRIAREHDAASTLQRALLPQELPLLPGVRLDAAYAPASGGTAIGGDWYDVFPISDRRLGISVGDVAGHGLRAAAIMGNVRQAIRTVAYINDDPAFVLEHINRALCRSEGATLITAFFATLDLLDGSLRYCLAGHPPPMVIKSSGSVGLLAGKGFVLAVDPRARFETLETTMDVGSGIVLYTDGLVEAERNYFQGVAKLREAIELEYRNASSNIAEAIQQRVFAQHPPRDDSALLFMGITALGASALQTERLVWSVDARSEKSAHRARRALMWHLGEIAGDADLSASELIVGELLGNVARHTPGLAEVILEVKSTVATLRVIDGGPCFDASVNCDIGDVLSESGRGLFLIQALTNDFTVEWTGEGNCVSAVLPLEIHADDERAPAATSVQSGAV